MGLGLTAKRWWGTTPREYDALLEVWEMSREFQASMFFQLRADIHNGWMPREDKRAWTAQDMGASVGEQDDPRGKQTNEEKKRMLKRRFRKKGDKSALDGLVGQPLPIPIDRKVG